ncbi:MAG: hypothetical protein WBB25_04990 [Sulfitobacter sp.]
MIDFFFAMLAAGINTADTHAGKDRAAVLAAPKPPEIIAAPQTDTVTEPGTPTVSIGEGVTIGTGSVIAEGSPLGSAASEPASTGAGLLDGTSEAVTPAVSAPEPQVTPDTSRFNMAVVPAGLAAEPQEPTGKFTTAAEIRPIMDATRGKWVAVREYDGKDLLYVTHIWGWRCGLKAMAISVNGEAMQNWPLPPCHEEYSTPNAVLEEDGQPYLSLRLGAVQTIDIQIVYDDLGMDVAHFERGRVLIP